MYCSFCRGRDRHYIYRTGTAMTGNDFYEFVPVITGQSSVPEQVRKNIVTGTKVGAGCLAKNEDKVH